MINFFRKIRQRLLTENKFSKYLLYAIGEIVLVVIGILIALQVNNLNEDYKEKDALISILNNAKTYITAEINKEEGQRQMLLGKIDTVHIALKIIEEVNVPSPDEQKLLDSAFRNLDVIGLRSHNVSTLLSLSASISKSKSKSKHELVRTISQLMNNIEQGKDLLDDYQENLFDMDRSIDPAILRFNSRNEVIYNFELIKTAYKLHHFLVRSRQIKHDSLNWGIKIINNYTLLYEQIEDLLKELE
jgi:hypothetical protein